MLSSAARWSSAGSCIVSLSPSSVTCSTGSAPAKSSWSASQELASPRSACVGHPITCTWFSLFGFVFSIAMGGASLPILWPLAARWFVKRLGLALGMLTAAPALVSTLLAPISGLVLANYGWKDGWLALGAIILFVALPIGLKFLRNWPSDIGLKPDGDPETPPEIQIRGSAPALRRGRFEADRWWRAFRSPPIWFLLPALAVGGFTGSVVSVYVVSFAHEQGYSLTTVSIILLVMAMLRGVGAVAGGWLADRFVRKKVLAAIYLAQGIAFVALAVGSQTLAGLWVFAVVAGLCGAVWMPVAFTLVVDVYGLRWLGTIWGIAFLCQQMGNLVGPPLGGLAYDLIGSYALVFVACASMQILASVAVFAINEQKYSARYQAAVGRTGGGELARLHCPEGFPEQPTAQPAVKRPLRRLHQQRSPAKASEPAPVCGAPGCHRCAARRAGSRSPRWKGQLRPRWGRRCNRRRWRRSTSGRRGNHRTHRNPGRPGAAQALGGDVRIVVRRTLEPWQRGDRAEAGFVVRKEVFAGLRPEVQVGRDCLQAGGGVAGDVQRLGLGGDYLGAERVFKPEVPYLLDDGSARELALGGPERWRPARR